MNRMFEPKLARRIAGLSVASLVALVVACSGKPPPPPDNPDRDLPGMGTAPHVDRSPYVDDSGTPVQEIDGGICCNVRFAILSDGTEQSVRLKSDLPPLRDNGGVALTLDAGVWSTTVCMPDSFNGTYFYEAQLPSQGATPYLDYRVNFHAQTVATAEHDAENLFSFDGAQTCADLNASAHSDVSEPDAGMGAGGGSATGGGSAGGGAAGGGSAGGGSAGGGAAGGGAAGGGAAGGGAAGGGSAGGGSAGGGAAGGGAAGGGAAGGGAAGGGSATLTKSVITGSCDVIGTPTVLLNSSGMELDDIMTATTAMPFAFSFYGTAITHFAASSNGFAYLLPANSAPSDNSANTAIPDVAPPNGFVAPFWDDLTSGVSTTSAIQTGVFGSPGSRHLTLEWSEFTAFLGPQVSRFTFQVKFFETSNAIEFHYCSIAANGDTATFEQGFGATVGVESPTGASGVQHSNNAAVLNTATGIRFQ